MFLHALDMFFQSAQCANHRPIPLRPRPSGCRDVSSTPPPPKVIYVVLLAVACLVNAANLLSTLASLKAKHLFTPEGKWSPLSYIKLTHEVRKGKGDRVLCLGPS